MKHVTVTLDLDVNSSISDVDVKNGLIAAVNSAAFGNSININNINVETKEYPCAICENCGKTFTYKPKDSWAEWGFTDVKFVFCPECNTLNIVNE